MRQLMFPSHQMLQHVSHRTTTLTDLYSEMSNNWFCSMQSTMYLYEYTFSLFATWPGANSLNINKKVKKLHCTTFLHTNTVTHSVSLHHT